MKRVKHDDLIKFKPWYNFIKSSRGYNFPSRPPLAKDRYELINEDLKPYRAVWDIRINGDLIMYPDGSKDLIFETEEAYTWFVLKWS
jgi:hypothetical protein